MEPIASFVSVSKRYAERIVFDAVSFSVSAGERVGILGPNGAGKTTLLRLLVGEEAPDLGSIARKRDLALGYVPQTPAFDPSLSVAATVAGGQAASRALIARAEAARAALAEAHDDAATGAKRARELQAVSEELDRTSGWDPDREVRRALQDLGLDGGSERALGTLSGGEQRRVALARALVSRSELLVLDEPTNHLDLETIQSLEERLLEHRGTVVFVTHDRVFLDRIATRLIEIDRGALFSFEGVYADYIERKAERAEREAREEASRKNTLRRELAWLRRGTRAQRTKNKDHVARVEALAVERPTEQDGRVELAIPTGPRLGSTVLELRNVSKSVGGKALIRNLSVRIEPGDRIGVVGRNGAGKTTLVHVLTGEAKPDSGDVIVGANTRFLHARQERDELDPELTVRQAVSGDSDWVVVGDERITVRAYLLRFLFSPDALETKLGRISGGERSRVQLARMLRGGGNFVILDEPTNDLDLPTLRSLEEALVFFPGVVLVVSHDRAFLGQVATRILGFEENGRVEVSDGGLDLYLERRERRLALARARAVPEKRVAQERPAATGPRKLTWTEQRALEELELAIPAAEEQARALTKKLEDPALYEGDARDARRLGEELRAKQDEVARLYARWEELEARR
ncbi:ABC-F family ATP-binding cassette domain-containing protein [bacterium]|nr:ABC-F family ATP-binding cassette domain-containing protein [bacterium]